MIIKRSEEILFEDLAKNAIKEIRIIKNGKIADHEINHLRSITKLQSNLLIEHKIEPIMNFKIHENIVRKRSVEKDNHIQSEYNHIFERIKEFNRKLSRSFEEKEPREKKIEDDTSTKTESDKKNFRNFQITQTIQKLIEFQNNLIETIHKINESLKNKNNLDDFSRKIKENDKDFFLIIEKSEKILRENNVYMEIIDDVNKENLDKEVSMIWKEKMRRIYDEFLVCTKNSVSAFKKFISESYLVCSLFLYEIVSKLDFIDSKVEEAYYELVNSIITILEKNQSQAKFKILAEMLNKASNCLIQEKKDFIKKFGNIH